jgi:hypothetical protein
MTEYQQAVIDSLARIEFFAHAGAFGIAWIAGQMTWKLLIYGKNHKDLW